MTLWDLLKQDLMSIIFLIMSCVLMIIFYIVMIEIVMEVV